MPVPHRSRFAVASVLFLVLLTSPWTLAAAEKRLITETDLFQFVWIADPQISPDGRQVAFVRVTVERAYAERRTPVETWSSPTFRIDRP